MKNSIKKIISMIMCMVMLLAMSTVVSNAAKYDDPVFELVVLSENNSEVTVSLNLVSGKFHCADFSFQAKSGYVCKNIAPSALASNNGAFGQHNLSNGKVSVLFQNDFYSAVGSFYTATFTKPNSSAFKTGDIVIDFSNCSILEKGETLVLNPFVSYGVMLSETEISMNYKDSATIEYSAVVPAGATVVWSTSNDDVATVDDNGSVYASGKGDATITCSVVDAAGIVIASGDCDVNVKYSVGQWLIIILLFGFIWYI